MNNQNKNIVIGADIGGSHITAAVVNINDRCLIDGTSVRKDVNSKSSANEILKDWLSALKEVIASQSVNASKLAFAMPGPFDYENGISLIKGVDKYESIYGINIKQFFADELSIKPENILFRNDAEAFLHGEVFCGAGRNASKVIGLTLGTGFGSAISSNGLTKDLNLGGEKFLDSIADDYFTTRWFIKRFKELTGQSVNNVKEMVSLIKENSSGSQIFDEFSDNLAIFLAPCLKEKEISLVIIGGNIANAQHLFLPQLTGNLLKCKLDVVFKRAELNEEASLIGAAATFEVLTLQSDIYGK